MFSLIGKAREAFRREGSVATARKVLLKARSLLHGSGAGALATSGSTSADSSRGKTFAELASFLGLTSDPEYAAEREAARAQVWKRLVGCAPEDAFPGEMEGYLAESALRFWQTLEWVEQALGDKARGPGCSILEVGSNPYFLTILLVERSPAVRHMGLNYFGDPREVGTVRRQRVVDPLGRLTESTYLYADIERHPLDDLDRFDLCLFCEVIEHLPFDPAWALFNLARRVKPGGRMILTTPNPARLENIVRLVFHDGSKDDPISGYGIHGRHNREYSVAELRDLLEGTGFSVVRTRTLDVVPTQWSRSAEELGYGQYVMVEARLDAAPRVYRPAWLYRSFAPDLLAREASLATPEPG